MGKIRDIMNRRVITIDREANALDAARILRESDISFLVVVDNGAPAGVVTERDFVRKMVCDDRRASEVPLKEIVSSGFLWVGSDVRIEDAVQKMLNNNIRRLVVIDDQKLTGVVTQTDLISFLRSKLLINATMDSIDSSC